MELTTMIVRSNLIMGYVWLLSSIIGAIAICIKVWRICDIRLESQEPPMVRHIIPSVGHLWGLVRHSHDYLNSLCQNTSYPIFTIPVAFGKVYVVGSPTLVQDVFRNRNLSFAPFVVEFVYRMKSLSPHAKQAYAQELHTRVMRLFAAKLNGSARKRMVTVALEELARLLPDNPSNTARGQGDKNKRDPVNDLWIWIRDLMTFATTSSLLGKRNNPWIKDPSLVEAYWKFEAGDPSGRTSIIDVTYRDSKKSHDSMVAALEAYFAAGHELPFPKAVFDEENDDLAAPITADLSAIQRDHGFNVREIGATYVTIVHGALVNMVPTLFWCIAYVFSRPLLVTRLRDELLAAVVIKNTNDEQQYALVDTDSIEGRCPLLLSVFRETQRLVAVGTLHRRVVEDTVVSDDCSGGGETGQKRSYLLKKGTSILIPVANNHRSQLIWGATGNEFYADRFLGLYPGNGNKNHPFNATAEKVVSKEMLDESASARSRKMAYFPFGGGKELCPGRNFATTQVLGTMTVLILGYHIEAANGGPLKQPSFSPSKMTAATARPHPDADLRGRVKRREGWEQVVWGVKPV